MTHSCIWNLKQMEENEFFFFLLNDMGIEDNQNKML